MKIRTRFAPSPTGFLHIGGLRTALYSYAFAKNKNGQFVLRVEDTDQSRYVPEAAEGIYRMLNLFGLEWDEGPKRGGPHAPYIQSERVKTGIYKKYAEKLVSEGHAYYCFHPAEEKAEIELRHQKKEIKLRDQCRHLTPEEVQKKIKAGEKPAIRLRMPENEVVSFVDFIRGKEVSWNTNDLDEVMLLKSDGFPTYHLGVVVDDSLMKISPILRGQEWLPSAPVHILLFNYLGFKIPQIGHYSLILDPDGGKLSKRKGSVSCEELLTEGYLPEALLNFIMLLGWAPKDNRELFTLKEFVTSFDKGSLQTANSVFNRKKLVWFNGVYIRQMPDEVLVDYLLNPPVGKTFVPEGLSREMVLKTIPLVKERLRTLGEYSGMVEFLVHDVQPDPALVVPKNKTASETKQALLAVHRCLSAISENEWRVEKLEKAIHELLEKELKSWEIGSLFMALRVAVTGKTITPPLFESMALLGRTQTLSRIQTPFPTPGVE